MVGGQRRIIVVECVLLILFGSALLSTKEKKEATGHEGDMKGTHKGTQGHTRRTNKEGKDYRKPAGWDSSKEASKQARNEGGNEGRNEGRNHCFSPVYAAWSGRHKVNGWENGLDEEDL